MKVRRIDFSPDEWLSGAMSLKADQRGCYVTIIMMIYSHGRPVLDSDRDNAHACNVTIEKWRTIRANLIEKGKLYLTEDGRISNRRCEIELERARARTDRARENGYEGGKKSGAARAKSGEHRSGIGQESWQNRSGIGESPKHESMIVNGLAEADACLGNEANHQPSTINHQLPDKNPPTVPHPEPSPSSGAVAPDCVSPKAPRPRKPSDISKHVAESFERWWSEYPRKVAKDAALTAYAKVISSERANEADLIIGVRRFAQQCTGKDPAYIAHATTWLNQGRWKDEPEPQHDARAGPRQTGNKGDGLGTIIGAFKDIHDLLDANGGRLPDHMYPNHLRMKKEKADDDFELPF